MKLPFDKTYCIHLASEKDRYNSMITKFNKLNIKDQVNIWWTTKRDISNEIGDSMKSLHTTYYDYFKESHNKYIYGSVFNCAFEHLTIIKQAYERDFNSILIMEDDIKFIDNLELIQKYFNNIPKDFDIIRYYTQLHSVKSKENLYELNNINNKYSTVCYALSRNGMKLLIDEYSKNFMASDLIIDGLIGKCNYYTPIDNIIREDLTVLSNITLFKRIPVK